MPAIVAESLELRRIVGRVDPGQDVVEALAALCRRYGVRAGEVRATGVLRSVHLSELAPGGGPYRPTPPIEGPVTLIQAYGNVSLLGEATVVTLRAVVSWDDGGQARIAGGHVLSARPVTFEFVMDAFDDLTIERRMDPVSGLPVFATLRNGEQTMSPIAAPAEPVAPPRPASSPAQPRGAHAPPPGPPPTAAIRELATAPMPERRPTGWDAVAQASEALDMPDDDWVEGPEAELKRGDVLVHPRFGRCRVLRIEDDERVVTADEARKPRTISLEHVSVRRDLSGDGRVFEVRVRRS